MQLLGSIYSHWQQQVSIIVQYYVTVLSINVVNVRNAVVDLTDYNGNPIYYVHGR